MLGRGGHQAVDQRGVDKKMVAADANHVLGGVLFQGLGKTPQAVRFGAYEKWHVGGNELSHETMIGVVADQHDHSVQAQGIGNVADDPFQNRPSPSFLAALQRNWRAWQQAWTIPRVLSIPLLLV